MNGNSAVANIAYWVGVAGITSAVLGILGIHAGLLPPLSGFYLFSLGTLVGGSLAFLLGLAGLFTTRGGFDPRSRSRAWTATGMGFVLVGLVFTAAAPGSDFPPINDITTDLEDPPSFAPASRVPAYAGFDMNYPADFVPVVQGAYPDLQTFEPGLAPANAYAAAIQAARSLGWEITDESPAQRRFDATDTTAVFRFVDDITVRIRPLGSGSEVDIRSRSRVGRGDLGANAIRIRAFIEELARS